MYRVSRPSAVRAHERSSPGRDSCTFVITIASVVSGDANGDGKVDANDIVEIVNYMMGKPSANFYLKAADANNDGKVDIADIIQIANTILAGK